MTNNINFMSWKFLKTWWKTELNDTERQKMKSNLKNSISRHL